jgi:hypothetical protein
MRMAENSKAAASATVDVEVERDVMTPPGFDAVILQRDLSSGATLPCHRAKVIADKMCVAAGIKMLHRHLYRLGCHSTGTCS